MTPKAIVTVIASLLIVCSAVVIALHVVRFGFGQIGPQSVRFALTCALSVSLIRGWSPGRWITVALMGLAVISLLVSGVNFAGAGQLGVELMVLTVIYAACLIGLLTPFAGRHFSGKAAGELESTEPPPEREPMG